MKFRCDSCGAQYAIADEKVGKKGVKVKCKKCSQVITVKPAEAAREPSQPVLQADPRDATVVDRDSSSALDQRLEAGSAPTSEPVDRAAPRGEEEELRSALDNILGDVPDVGGQGREGGEDEDGDLDRASTRVFNVEEMQQVQAEREAASQQPRDEGEFAGLIAGARPAAGQSSVEVAADAERMEWYAAVDDQQVGPMNLAEFAERAARGELDGETLVWKSGFGDWLPVSEVPELQALLGEPRAEEPEERPGQAAAEEDWSRAAEGGEDQAWSPRAASSLGAWDRTADEADDREEDAGEEREPRGRDDLDADEEREEAGASGFADQEPSNAASALAFAGADVDWKPAALSSLSSLAEEELASLRPVDPEPERDEEDALLGGGSGPEPDAGDQGEMEDGDSSLIAQIAQEEETKLRQHEEQRLAEEREAELKRKRDEEAALAAQAAAKREQYEERVTRTTPPAEQFVPPRAVLPKWAIGLMAGGGVMLLVLVGLVGYILASPKQAAAPLGEVQPVAVPTQPVPVAQPTPVAQPVPVAQPGQPSPAEAGAPVAEPGPAAETVASAAPAGPSETKPEPKPEPKPRPVVAAVGKAHPKPPPPRPLPPAGKPAKPASSGRDDFADEDDAPAKPRAEEKKPPVRKSGGGLLDFEDEDDKAFGRETGKKTEAAKAAPPPEVKKELPPLSNSDVLAVMKQHLEEFKACNKEQKKRDASVQGKMVVNFTIQTDGKVSAASVDASTSQFNNTFVAGCITQVIKRLRFPAFSGGPKSVPFPFTVN